MVAQISEPELFFFKAMVQNYGEGSYTLKLSGTDDYASIKRISTKRKIEVEEVDGDPKVHITIKFEGILSEFSGQKATPETIEKIIKELEQTIVEQSQSMLKEFQEKNIDPVGLGYLARHTNRRFEEGKWKVDYPNIKMDVHAEVTITETGIIQ